MIVNNEPVTIRITGQTTNVEIISGAGVSVGDNVEIHTNQQSINVEIINGATVTVNGARGEKGINYRVWIGEFLGSDKDGVLINVIDNTLGYDLEWQESLNGYVASLEGAEINKKKYTILSTHPEYGKAVGILYGFNISVQSFLLKADLNTGYVAPEYMNLFGTNTGFPDILEIRIYD